MNEKILFVDDDPNILSAIKRQLRKRYDLVTASSGTEGLQAITTHGPFAVVVSDMRMPGMDGVAFLRQAQEQSPHSVLLMLTGNADQQTAIDAVNEGRVFRFMTKPCSIGQLSANVDAAMEQYRLLHTERELLEGTLNGTINLLVDMISLAANDVSRCDICMRQTAREVARALRLQDTWKMEMATTLSRIASITLPPDTQSKMGAGAALTPEEQSLIEKLPETGYRLLANIPRLQEVARIVLYQDKNFDGTGFPRDRVAGEEIPIESRILKVLHDMKAQESRGLTTGQALEHLKKLPSRYDPQVLNTVEWFFGGGGEAVAGDAPKRISTAGVEVNVLGLQAGQTLISDVETVDGTLLFKAGQQLSDTLVARLLSYHHTHKIKEPILVELPETN